MWARMRCSINSPRFLADCCMRRLIRASFFAVFCVVCFSGLCLDLVMSVFDLSPDLLVPMCR